MKQNYLVAPLICMAAFVGYFFYYQSQPKPPKAGETRKADAFADRDGRKEGEAEFAAGKLVLIESGPQVSWDGERRAIAREKYGVELRRVESSGTESDARYVDAFNRVMRPKVIERHGRGFFEALHQEAIALHSAGSPAGKK
jgi:hypothetical protein